MADITAQVVKDDYSKPYGTYVRVSAEQYSKWGPRGAGQLRAPSKGVPEGARVVDMRENPDDDKDLAKHYDATEQAIELAEEHGLLSQLSTLEGSGPLGRIYKRDVQALLKNG